MKKMSFALALAALMMAMAPASAAPIHIAGDTANSTSGLGNFTATLTYSASDASNATLIVSLTNTTPSAGGYITAFVLNNPGNAITGITQGDPDLNVLGGPTFQNSVNGGPFGQFDFGVSTGGSFEGGGPPSDGLAVGDTGSVTFTLTGTGLDLLNEHSFVNELSVGPGDGEGHKFMVVRFRGMEDEGSDKVPGQTVRDTPEPSTLLLTMVGLGAMVPLWRRRRA